MIDERFCTQIGTQKQHKYAAFLASSAGYDRLRDAVADFCGCSVSKAGGITINVKRASEMIDWLKAKGSK